MADLGNLFFTLGISTKDFDKKMEDEIKKAQQLKKELQEALKGTSLGADKSSAEAMKLMAEANKLNAEANKIAAQTERSKKKAIDDGTTSQKKQNDETSKTSDLYQKLYNKILLINEEQSKLSTNAKFGFDSAQVQDAIQKLETFKSLLKDALASGSKADMQAAMKLYSNQDYAVLSKQVSNLINEGNKMAKQKQQELQNTAKVAAEEEKRAGVVASLTGQLTRLYETEKKVSFAQQKSNANGVLTDNAITRIQRAKESLEQLIAKVKGGEVNKTDIATAMMNASAAIREANTAISQQKILNQENASEAKNAQRAIVEGQRRINEAQAQNARLVMSSNGHLSITKRLIGEIGTVASMYFSVFAVQNFLSSLIRIRGEFDMQYISLKAILQSGEQATKLFEQIKGLAVVSPFKFMDLTTYAKQLSAYQIPTNELFNTTKRLADLSSGLGVDMSRIILAYGQVRSAAFLRGQELRQFTEAGIPMVDELANRFTKLTGKVTTAGDVFKKISDRQVPFQMVKDVIDNLTSEGGKFYNMQEKQAESLKGKVSNLADQYDIMMNRIGESNDSTLKGGVDMLNSLMQHSELFISILKDLAVVYGIYKVATLMQTTAMGKNLAVMTAEEAKSRVKRANMLEEARLYRTLTDEELKLSRYHGILSNTKNNFGSGVFMGRYSRLNQYDYRELALNDRISKNEVLRLGYLGKINQATMAELATNGKITTEELKQVTLARDQIKHLTITRSLSSLRLNEERVTNGIITARLALMRAGQGIMSAFSTIFNPATLILGGATLLWSMWQDHEQQQQKIRDDAKQLSSDMKEEWNDIQKFIADHPIEIAIKGGEGAITEYINQYADELRKILPEDLANAQIAGSRFDVNGNQQSIENQLKSMAELVKSAQQAKAIIEDNSDAMSSAAESTNGWFSQGLITNFKQFVGSVSDYRDELNNINREQFEKTVSGEGMNPTAKYFRDNAEAAAEATKAIRDNVNASKLIDIAKMNYKKTDIETPNGKYMQYEFLSDMGIGNGFSAASKEMENNMKDAENDMSDMIEQFKKNLADKNIDWASKQGHDIAETFKQKLMEQNGITGTDEQTMFSFMFDEKMYGKTDAAFSLLVQRMKSSADRNIRDAVSKFEQDGVWTPALENSINKAKDETIAKFPFLKQDLMRSWNVNPPVFKAMIETYLNAQKLQEWQKELLAITGGEYDIEIKTSSNIDEAIKAIEEKYKTAKQYIHDQKPLMIKIGYKFDGKPVKTGNKKQYNFGTHKWETSGGEAESAIQDEVIQDEKEAKAFKRLLDRKLVTDQKLKGEKSGSKGTKKDVYTETLKRQYEQLKKAIQSYNDLIKSMGSDKAMETVKRNSGLAIDAKYLTTYGMVTLANDYMAKNIKNTDTAKGFKDTLIEDRRAARNNRDKGFFDAQSKAILDGIQITKDQYKVYDDMFAKLGNARMASVIAFGRDTKPYNTLVDMLKARFNEMSQKIKMNKGFSFEQMLGMTPEDRAKMPENIQKLYKEIEDANTNNLSQLRSQFINAFSNTDDSDIKIAINENLRKNIIDNINEILGSGASESDIKKATDAINGFYNKAINDIKIDKLKKNLDWEELYGNISTLSMTSLKLLEKQLEAIIKKSKEIDPKKMKEFVSKLREVRDAEAKIEPLDNIFGNFREASKAREILDSFEKAVTSVNELKHGETTLGEAYANSVASEDDATKKMIEQTQVTVKLKDETGKLVESTMTYKELLDKLHTAQTTSTSKSETFMTQFQSSGFSNSGFGKLISMKAGGGAGGSLAIVDAIIQAVHTNIQGLSDVIKDWDIKEDSEFAKFTSKLQRLDKFAYGGWENLKSGNVVGAMSDMVQGWGAAIDLFSSDSEAQYQRDVKSHEKLMSVWNDLIDLKKEYLKTGYTEDINQSESEIKRLYSLEEESARTLGKEYLNAGARTFKSSHGIHQRGNISKEGWNELLKWKDKEGISDSLYNSVKKGRMTGLFDLSVEQLKALKEDAPTFFAKLDDDTQKYINQIISGSKSMSDALDEVKQKWTSTTVDELISGYSTALDSMDDMTKTFSNNFTKTLRTAIINAFMQSSAVKGKIQALYDKMYQYASNDIKGPNGSIYSEGEIAELKDDISSINNDVKTEQEALKELGLYADQSASSLSGGIKSITEETADLLASYVNAIRADVSFIRTYYVRLMEESAGRNDDVVATISVAVAKIENNTRRSADNTDCIVDWMNSVTMTTSNGRALRT